MRRIVLVLTIALAIVLACAGVVLAQGSTTSTTTPAPEQQSSAPSALSNGLCSSTNAGPPIPVMTRNLYLGADLDPVFAASATGDGRAIIAATTTAWQNVKATNFPERAGAIADEIERSHPLLVGLQEVSMFRTGPPDSITGNLTPNSEHLVFDYLELLQNELDQRDLHYAPVTITTNTDAENPGFTAPGVLEDIRLTDRDVILARTDGPKLALTSKQADNFEARASVPIGTTGHLDLLRGWGSVDVTLRGQTFRFINTHLEQEGPFNTIQVDQGEEILSGPANTSLPVILVGDFNSRADGTGTPTYNSLIGAGFKDAWSATHPGELGNTWGHDADLLNTTVNLTRRLDLVLFRNNRCAFKADVVGDELKDRTPSGLWPSDHAGLVATLRGE
jgi:Endonuclease/Exonuclease/phosphatase family